MFSTVIGILIILLSAVINDHCLKERIFVVIVGSIDISLGSLFFYSRDVYNHQVPITNVQQRVNDYPDIPAGQEISIINLFDIILICYIHLRIK